MKQALFFILSISLIGLGVSEPISEEIELEISQHVIKNVVTKAIEDHVRINIQDIVQQGKNPIELFLNGKAINDLPDPWTFPPIPVYLFIPSYPMSYLLLGQIYDVTIEGLSFFNQNIKYNIITRVFSITYDMKKILVKGRWDINGTMVGFGQEIPFEIKRSLVAKLDNWSAGFSGRINVKLGQGFSVDRFDYGFAGEEMRVNFRELNAELVPGEEMGELEFHLIDMINKAESESHDEIALYFQNIINYVLSLGNNTP